MAWICAASFSVTNRMTAATGCSLFAECVHEHRQGDKEIIHDNSPSWSVARILSGCLLTRSEISSPQCRGPGPVLRFDRMQLHHDAMWTRVEAGGTFPVGADHHRECARLPGDDAFEDGAIVRHQIDAGVGILPAHKA